MHCANRYVFRVGLSLVALYSFAKSFLIQDQFRVEENVRTFRQSALPLQPVMPMAHGTLAGL